MEPALAVASKALSYSRQYPEGTELRGKCLQALGACLIEQGISHGAIRLDIGRRSKLVAVSSM